MADYKTEFDYIVVGGGTAGCIVAARLSEDPTVTVCLVEAGPSDSDEPRARSIRRWAEMLEGDYDLDYRSVPQARGNSHIRQARLRILGGCSTANTMISWRPLRGDLDEWAALGLAGWGYDDVVAYWDRLRVMIQPVAEADRNPFIRDAIEAAAKTHDLPLRETWNDIEFDRGAGFFEIGYDPADNARSSTSRSYLHSQARPANLTLMLNTVARNLVITDGTAVGVIVASPARNGDPEVADAIVTDREGQASPNHWIELRARRELIVSCGAIDTPALLQRSGIGPAGVLEAAGVEVVLDLPGVGANLQDHAEGLVVWEARGDRSEVSATGWDGGYVMNIDGSTALPDVSTHIPLHSWTAHVERIGIEIPANNVSFAPNVTKPRSRGRVWITSPDPSAPPSIDYGYFTDPDGRDEKTLVAGVRLARQVATIEPFASHVMREVFPGPDVQSDEDLSSILRATHQTVYHVSCTARMGASDDPDAVLDERLRVRGIRRLRIVDASVFPTIPALNPVGFVMTVAERAVDLILEDSPRSHETSRPVGDI